MSVSCPTSSFFRTRLDRTRHPFTGPITDVAGTERVGDSLTVPDADLAKMDRHVKGGQA